MRAIGFDLLRDGADGGSLRMKQKVIRFGPRIITIGILGVLGILYGCGGNAGVGNGTIVGRVFSDSSSASFAKTPVGGVTVVARRLTGNPLNHVSGRVGHRRREDVVRGIPEQGKEDSVRPVRLTTVSGVGLVVEVSRRSAICGLSPSRITVSRFETRDTGSAPKSADRARNRKVFGEPFSRATFAVISPVPVTFRVPTIMVVVAVVLSMETA